MEIVARELSLKYPKGTRVGVFATNGTLMTKLYYNALLSVDLEPVIPKLDSEVQANIMRAIYDPKFGIKKVGSTPQSLELLHQAMKWAENEELKVVIAGCTEIPLSLNNQTYQGEITIINPMQALGRFVLKYSFDMLGHKI
jgi:aspartate racemase